MERQQIKQPHGINRSIAGLVVDILFTHYNGITCLDKSQTRALRTTYQQKHKLLESLSPSADVKAMLTWGQNENIIRSYKIARQSRNTALAKKLLSVINALPASDKAHVLATLNGTDLPLLKQDVPILLCKHTVERNKEINALLECEFGGGHYRLLRREDHGTTHVCLGAKIYGKFVDTLLSLVALFKIEHFAEDKLADTTVMCDERIELVKYLPEQNRLLVSPGCFKVSNAGILSAVVREAVIFLQNMHMTPQDLFLMRAMCKFAIKTGEVPLRAAMVDVVRIAMAEVIAIATGNGDLDRLSESRAVVILSKVVSYLRRRRKMSVDGATRLCLKVGMGWNGNEPVVNRFVCFFKDFACCSYDEAIRQLFQTEPCHFSDKLDKGLVLNMVHRVMCNDISDASPFQIVSEDFKVHLSTLEEKIRFDLNSFVVSYHDYKNDEVNPACVLAYTLWNLNEIVCGQIKKHLPWVEAVLSGDRKCRGASFMTLNSVSLFELCDYIEHGLLGEYAGRRKRMGRFKKAFIGKNDMRVANSIIKEMCDDVDRAAARRWNALVKSLAEKEKGVSGLPRLSAKVERLRHDSVTWMLVEDLAGYSFVDIVGRCVAKESCLVWVKDEKRRRILVDEIQDYLATAILGLMYGIPAIMSRSPEVKLGLFAELYYSSEEDVFAALNIKLPKNVQHQ